LKEALDPAFKEYASQIIKNAAALANELAANGFNLVTGGTENHLMLIDLRNKGVTGKQMAKAMDKAGIVCNYNSVPNDDRKPFDPSGIRIGTASVTTRGFQEEEMKKIAGWMTKIALDHDNEELLLTIEKEVRALCDSLPVPKVFV
ncbi:MAG TPA: serine hydroxymethyltransferase, partial [Spirochaetota bacterium]|nr:serine hydroxymethyltransferase [Spirochaetota bacterium]